MRCCGVQLPAVSTLGLRDFLGVVVSMSSPPIVIDGDLFLFATGGQTAARFRKVHFMPVKFGTVHAGELGFAARADAARAAHAYAVNHDGVEADRGFDAVGVRGFGHNRHHGHRAHGHDFKDALVLFKPVAQKTRHKALVAVTAVIGGDEQFVDNGDGAIFGVSIAMARGMRSPVGVMRSITKWPGFTATVSAKQQQSPWSNRFMGNISYLPVKGKML